LKDFGRSIPRGMISSARPASSAITNASVASAFEGIGKFVTTAKLQCRGPVGGGGTGVFAVRETPSACERQILVGCDNFPTVEP
jgi:hypothetical protein